MYITGPNGSGKSTLLQITGGLSRPTTGAVSYLVDEQNTPYEKFRHSIGFTGPEINPYDVLTSVENIKFAAQSPVSDEEINLHLNRFGLYQHRLKPVKHYSSGMKQRLKIILSVINRPAVLMLDEPGSNLDLSGKDLLYSLIDDLRKETILIIATNEKEEIELCGKGIDLG